MVSLKKSATLLLLAYICECDAQKEHTATLPSNADDERSNRSLLLNLPDCSNPENYGAAQCICRHPSNAGMDLCKKWFEKVSVNIFQGTDTKIIGGSDVSNGDYPWFAKSTRGNSGKWDGCGGALVSPQFVLTAAHCIGYFNGFEIGALCHNSNTWYPNGNCGQTSQVISSNKIIKHPGYSSATTDNDYALVRLSSPATATPVTMDMNGLSGTYTSSNKLWTIGFGNTLSNGNNFPSRMKHVEVSYVPTNTCNRNNKYNGQITQNMMCAADPNEDSCQGDSGGPLYDKANDVLVGVVSWGYGCADPDYPGVYSRISNQWTWIKNTICSDSGSVKPGFCDGTPTAPTAPNPSPVASPTSNSCTDTLDWHDSDGPTYNCEWYGDETAERDRCDDYGNYFEEFDQTANKACCACGGGKTGTGCQDSDDKFWYSSTKKKQCKFVGAKNTALRCGRSGVKEQCPVTCETGCKCFDTLDVFYVRNGTPRSCLWAIVNPKTRCKNFVVRSNCPISCGICDA